MRNLAGDQKHASTLREMGRRLDRERSAAEERFRAAYPEAEGGMTPAGRGLVSAGA
jgi:hypothetical protein